MDSYEAAFKKAYFLDSLIKNKGEPFLGGFHESLALEAVYTARLLYPDKPVRAVKHWLWLAFSASTPNDEINNITLPARIKADEVVYDENEFFAEDMSIISTNISKQLAEFIYEADDFTYILIGPGNIYKVDSFEYEVFSDFL